MDKVLLNVTCRVAYSEESEITYGSIIVNGNVIATRTFVGRRNEIQCLLNFRRETSKWLMKDKFYKATILELT